jgi:predicted molibdopterin-dependent oxidoreductase YjgC
MQIQIQQNIVQPLGDAQLVGSVIVTIGPENVIGAGAMWRVDNGAWQRSGETVSNLSVGTHTIDYSEVNNWTKPESQQLLIEEGKTIFEAAKSAGITIPTLCYNEKLAPYGGCRFCTVEISKGGRSRLVVSCVYNVEDGLVVKTATPKVIKIRKMLLELMLASAPILSELAKQYGIEKPRFQSEVTQCILCGQCVRYCAEVKKANAIGFVSRGAEREVMFIPEIAAKECPSCRECFALCPTDVLRANYLLAEALTFPEAKV